MKNDSDNRTVANVVPATARPGSDAFSAANVGGPQIGADMDPVLSIDHFRMRQPVFAPHPHAGFSAVSYVFEDSEGALVSRDSLGNTFVARPGGMVWTLAGRGVIHDEYPHQPGKLTHGLQIFVNLPAADKQLPPRVLVADGPDVPVVEERGARVRVLAGSAAGVCAGLEAPGGLTFLDVKLAPGATFRQRVRVDENAFIYVVAGEAHAGDERRRVGSGTAASFGADGEAVAVEAGDRGAQFVLFAARPLRERVVAYGPFIMSSEAQVASAIDDYRTGRMGRLEPMH